MYQKQVSWEVLMMWVVKPPLHSEFLVLQALLHALQFYGFILIRFLHCHNKIILPIPTVLLVKK